MPDAAIEPEDAAAELTAPGDCYCSWLTEEEVRRREAMEGTTAEARVETRRLLRLAEKYAANEPMALVAIAEAWKGLARL